MQPHIRGGILEFFPGTVQSLGGDPAALLEAADVAPEVMSIPGIYLPYVNYMTLLDCAARATGRPEFGLLMSRSANAETLGTTGIIMTQAHTLGAGWDALAHFYSLHDTYGTVKLHREGSRVILSYSLPRNDQPGTRQVYDVAAGVVVNIMRQFCGLKFRALEMGFPYPQPSDTEVYRELPADRLRFGAQGMEIHFGTELLRQELPGRTDELRPVLESYFSTHPKDGEPMPTSRVVEDMIRRLLPTGNCTLPMIAQTLSMTARTLQSRLDEENSSFRLLLEKVRREIATFHLRRGDMQLTQLAMVLGYSELSAFSRSFRGWYGVSPRQWLRQEHW